MLLLFTSGDEQKTNNAEVHVAFEIVYKLGMHERVTGGKYIFNVALQR